MSKIYNLEEEEYQILKHLLKVDKNITTELGTITRLEIELKSRKDTALKALENFKEQEKTLASSLQNKYGKGSINIDDKTFIANE